MSSESALRHTGSELLAQPNPTQRGGQIQPWYREEYDVEYRYIVCDEKHIVFGLDFAW